MSSTASVPRAHWAWPAPLKSVQLEFECVRVFECQPSGRSVVMPGARLTRRSADACHGIRSRLASGPPDRPAPPLGSHGGPEGRAPRSRLAPARSGRPGDRRALPASTDRDPPAPAWISTIAGCCRVVVRGGFGLRGRGRAAGRKGLVSKAKLWSRRAGRRPREAS